MGNTRTRKRPTGGRRRPVSGAGGKILGRVQRNAGRSWKRALRRNPALGVLLSIALAAVGVLMLMVGLLAENALYYLATALSGLGSVAVARARHLEVQRQQQQASRRPTVAQPAGEPRAREQRPAPDAEQSAGGPVKCTETSKPIDDCGCASRHVATADGARRYGLPVGSPMGRRAKSGRESATKRGAL